MKNSLAFSISQDFYRWQNSSSVITCHYNLYSHIEFYEKVKKYKLKIFTAYLVNNGVLKTRHFAYSFSIIPALQPTEPPSQDDNICF